MSLDQERTEILIGQEGISRLSAKHVMVVGLGGVGAYAAEAMARAGIGSMTIVDHDKVSSSNCNRQLPAMQSTIGQAKVEVMAQRLLDINPDLKLSVKQQFITPDNCNELLTLRGRSQDHPLYSFNPAFLDGLTPTPLPTEQPIDYLLDCIDSIACKAALVAACQQHGVAVASAMGAGGRLDVTKAKISTLKKTEVCPLAREMRGQMRKLGASLDYPVVYSNEIPVKGLPHQPIDGGIPGRPRAVNGTISYMPGLFGLMLAGFVIRQLAINTMPR